jgi:quercetin dioxygenase-like cupin family protein
MGTPWLSGWTAEDPVVVASAFVGHDEGEWVREQPFLERRDLGLAQVSGGKVGAAHLRIVGGEPIFVDWHCWDLDFELFFVLGGSLTIDTDGGTFTLGPGGSGYQPGLYWHRSRMSPDFECVLLTGPASGAGYTDRDAALPARAATLDPARAGVYTNDDPDRYVKREGPGFRARDLGTAGPSEGRIGATVYRANAPGGGSDWHAHTSAQWVFALEGETEISLDGSAGAPPHRLRRGAALAIGTAARHAQGSYGGDWAMLSLMLPAHFETSHGDGPEGAAA